MTGRNGNYHYPLPILSPLLDTIKQDSATIHSFVPFRDGLKSPLRRRPPLLSIQFQFDCHLMLCRLHPLPLAREDPHLRPAQRPHPPRIVRHHLINPLLHLPFLKSVSASTSANPTTTSTKIAPLPAAPNLRERKESLWFISFTYCF